MTGLYYTSRLNLHNRYFYGTLITIKEVIKCPDST